MFFVSLIFVIVFVFILSILVCLFKIDGDLTLMYYERFGRKPHFSNKVVWITGASSGIGEFLAYDFARLGAKLVLSGVSVEKLMNVERNVKGFSKEADVLLLPFRIENFSVHDECVDKVIQRFGHVDILVNNAGVSQRANFQDVNIEVDHTLFNVNVFGPVNLTRKVLQYMLPQNKGQIVVTSSTAGKVGAPYSCSYTGSKHALHGYFETLRSETIHTNLNICIACPGPVFSQLLHRCLTGKSGEVHDDGQPSTAKRMSTARCSELMIVAITNRLDECWICIQPILMVYYLAQYMPSIFKGYVLKSFNKERIQSLRRGE